MASKKTSERLKKRFGPAGAGASIGADTKEPEGGFWSGIDVGREALATLIVLVIVVVVFYPICRYDFVTWDDSLHVYQNPHLDPSGGANPLFFWRGVYQGLYIPITYTLWSWLARLGHLSTPILVGVDPTSLDPSVFHTANFVLHLLNTVLVYAILRLLLLRQLKNGRSWSATIAAGLGALLFALHPTQVESVAWISEMKGVLCWCFSLIAILLYLPFAYAEAPSGSKEKSGWQPWGFYGFATFALICALLSKPSAVTLPLVVLAIDLWVIRRPLRQIAVPLGGWLVLSAGFAVTAQQAQSVMKASILTPAWTRPFVALDALTFYLRKLVAPVGMAIDYGHTPSSVMHSHWLVLSVAIAVGVLAAAWLLRAKQPIYTAGLVIFVAGFLPTSGLVPFIFQLYSTTSDRYLYLSMLGPALVVAWLLTKYDNKILFGVAGVIVVLLAMQTVVLRQSWHNSDTLYQQALRVNPASTGATYNYGTILAREKHYVEGIRLLRLAEQIEPSPDASGNLALALDNYGRTLAVSGKVDEAMADFREAERMNPNLPDAHIDVAIGLARERDTQGAIAELKQALAVDPGNKPAQDDLDIVMRSAKARQPM